jgi:tetratricopeptide (TPR) repeat protein
MISAMDADLLDLARTVDLTVLGARVKKARVAKRLTQTEVAGAEMSTAYVSRIESGQRRPDPELLAVIASRVGVGFDELVMGTTRDKVAEARLGLVSAEVELRTGNSAGALDHVNETLMDLAGHGQADLQHEALRIKAGALEASGRLDEAIILLEDLTADAEHDTTWLKDMTALCRCYRVSGDLDRAVETGDRARVTLSEYGLRGTGQAVALQLSLSAAHFERGDTGIAARLCRRAIEDAEDQGLEKLGSTYWAASIIESRRGNHHAALALANKALAYIEMSDDFRQTAAVRNQLGVLQLRGSDPAAALSTLEHASAELTQTDAGAAVQASNLIARARAHLMLGEPERTLELAEQARTTASGVAPLVVVDGLVLQGQVESQRGDASAAADHYRQAVAILSGIGADRTAAQLWFELATHFEALGSAQEALDAYRRAAVSAGLSAINVTAATGQVRSEQHSATPR